MSVRAATHAAMMIYSNGTMIYSVHCSNMHHTIPHYTTIPYHTTPHHTTPYRRIPHYTVPHHTVYRYVPEAGVRPQCIGQHDQSRAVIADRIL